MHDRPFESMYFVMKLRPKLIQHLNDNILGLRKPDQFFRELYDILGDMFKRFKQLSVNEDEDNSDVVVRNLAFGVSAGVRNLRTYEKWLERNHEKIQNKLNVKRQIQDLFKKEMICLHEEEREDNQCKRSMGV